MREYWTTEHMVDCHVCGCAAVVSIHHSRYSGGGDENYRPHFNAVGEVCSPLYVPIRIRDEVGAFVSHEERERDRKTSNSERGFEMRGMETLNKEEAHAAVKQLVVDAARHLGLCTGCGRERHGKT